MRAFLAIFVSLIAAVLLAMTMAIYLPLEQVNKMFIAALSTPIVITAFAVWTLRVDQLKSPVIFFSVVVPCLFTAVVIGLIA